MRKAAGQSGCAFTWRSWACPTTYTNDYTWDGDRRVDWVMSEGKSQKSQMGSYELTGSGEKTKITYDLSVEIAIPVPGLIRRRIHAKVVDTALKDLKKRAEA